MSDKKIFIGVDIGGTNIKGVVLGEGEDILHQKSIPTQSEKGPDGITRRIVSLIKEGKTTLIRQLVGEDLNKISPQVIARAAREGDDVARSIWEREAFYLGTGIANLVSILNPEMIIIGGGVAGALDIMEEKIRKTLRERVYLGAEVDKLRIVKGKLGDIAGAVGAACWAMQSSGK